MSEREDQVIQQMLRDAEIYGYGNFIDKLQKAWQQMLQQEKGLSEKSAKLGSLQVMPLYDRIDKLEAELAAAKAEIERLRGKAAFVEEKQ